VRIILIIAILLLPMSVEAVTCMSFFGKCMPVDECVMVDGQCVPVDNTTPVPTPIPGTCTTPIGAVLTADGCKCPVDKPIEVDGVCVEVVTSIPANDVAGTGLSITDANIGDISEANVDKADHVKVGKVNTMNISTMQGEACFVISGTNVTETLQSTKKAICALIKWIESTGSKVEGHGCE
jgi:hypothetical protein